MIEFEAPFTCREISAKTCGKMSEEAVRAACHRSPQSHPLPHVRTGDKRPIIRIRWSRFVNWYEEEERLQVGV